MLRNFFVNLKKGTEYLNYGRHIIKERGAGHILNLISGNGNSGEVHILDLGCGHGTDLRQIRESVRERNMEKSGWKILLYGVENYGPYIDECELAGIRVSSLDIERDRLPGEGAPYDVIVANQVLEHTKEVFWIFAEVSRVLRPGGKFIVGVPNLASLHNRLLLLLGKHPTPIQTLSAHVRGFTAEDLRIFGTEGDFFKVTHVAGSNFYPFPVPVAKFLAKLFPSLAWGLFVEFERTDKAGNFLECLSGDENFLETPFYGSPQNPAPPLRTEKSNNAKTTLTKKKSTGVAKKKSRS